MTDLTGIMSMPVPPSPYRISASAPLVRYLKPYLWATVAVACAAVVAAAVEREVALPNLSLVFLSAVVLVGARGGIMPALYASVLGLATYNFFFTVPYYTFAVHDRGDVLTLLFFMLVAVLTGNLAGRLRDQFESMRENAARTEALYAFSRGLADVHGEPATVAYVAERIAATFGGRAAVFLAAGDDKGAIECVAVHPAGTAPSVADADAARRAFAGVGPDPNVPGLFAALTAGPRAIGAVAAFPDPRTRAERPEARRLLAALADQAALAIERARLAADVERAQRTSEAERLRAALLSSVSHDLRTPLSSIIGSATALASLGDNLSAPDRHELIQTIQAESSRLDRLVQNLLDMARLSHGGIRPRRDWSDLREVVGRAVFAQREVLAPFRVSVAIADDVPLLYVDPVLIEQAVVNVLDNAAKYAPEGGLVSVTAAYDGKGVDIRIEDEGPGIPPAERGRVFEMFYRGSNEEAGGGSGLGLAICKGFVEAHGGTVAIETARAGRGTAVVIRLPAERLPVMAPD